MSGGAVLVIWLFWIIILLVVYHKIFTVYYFNLGQGLTKEIVGACLAGVVLTALTLYLWYISAIIIILFGIMGMSKLNSKVPLVIAIIVAIVISFLGISAKNNSNNSQDNTESAFIQLCDKNLT